MFSIKYSTVTLLYIHTGYSNWLDLLLLSLLIFKTYITDNNSVCILKIFKLYHDKDKDSCTMEHKANQFLYRSNNNSVILLQSEPPNSFPNKNMVNRSLL